MYELQVLVTPSSVPCSSSADPTQNPAPVSLQVSVVNVSGDPLQLGDSGLRFDFAVDGGGDTSSSALILSSDSVTVGSTPPTPVQNVQATPTAGTLWSITPQQDGPCSFLAVPQPSTPAEDPGTIAPQGSVSFVFSNVLVDFVPGASPIKVSVIPVGTITTTGPAYLAKTPPGLGITSFAAAPNLVLQGGGSALVWSTIGAAACQLSWFPVGHAVVTYNGSALTSPATGLPVEVDGAQPVQVTINGQTQFTLSAQGASDLSENLVIDVIQPALYLHPAKLQVMPNEQFTLDWAAFSTSAPPTLSWTSDGGSIQATDAKSGQPIVPGQPLPSEGSANVRIDRPAQFTLEVPEKAEIRAIEVFIVDLGSVDAVPSEFTEAGPNGSLTLDATNATGFDITGPGGTQTFLLDNPSGGSPVPQTFAVVESGVSFNYIVVALGYTGFGSPANPAKSIMVHAKVALTAFGPDQAFIPWGATALLSWTSFAATEFTLTAAPGGTVASLPWGVSSLTVGPRTTTWYTLVASGDTVGDPAPSLTTQVTVGAKPKEKEKEKEKDTKESHVKEMAKEKEFAKEKNEHQPFIFRTNIPVDQTGTARAFLDPAQRPEPNAPAEVTDDDPTAP
jgi:hypothetical protein